MWAILEYHPLRKRVNLVRHRRSKRLLRFLHREAAASAANLFARWDGSGIRFRPVPLPEYAVFPPISVEEGR